MGDIFDDEDYMLWRLFTQARNAIHKLRHKELLHYGLTPRKAGILLILLAAKDDVNSYKIAKWLILEHHSVSELINRMEKEGLVNKSQNNDNNGRSITIRLTDKGVKAAEQAGKVKSFHGVMAIIPDKERKQFISTLKSLRNHALRELRITNRLPYPPF